MVIGTEFSQAMNETGVISPMLTTQGKQTYSIKCLSIITNELDIELMSFEKTIILGTFNITKLVDEPVKLIDESYTVSYA